FLTFETASIAHRAQHQSPQYGGDEHPTWPINRFLLLNLPNQLLHPKASFPTFPPCQQLHFSIFARSCLNLMNP
ncbi:MAG: hypothetical protein KDD02_22265, partial [Phaeodactylibacter sp.]|nr:hypothetical protein [Phaeodactylibacter sp.]